MTQILAHGDADIGAYIKNQLDLATGMKPANEIVVVLGANRLAQTSSSVEFSAIARTLSMESFLEALSVGRCWHYGQRKLPMNVVFSTTTSGRLGLFRRTITSLRNHVTDLSKVSHVLHLDEGSKAAELEQMSGLLRRALPHADHRCVADFRFANRAHHACMMQTWQELVVASDYVFHCEDDWEFVAGGPLISDAIMLMEANPRFGQVGVWRRPPLDGVLELQGVRYWEWHHDANSEFVHRLQGEDEIDPAWPHFSLRPSIIRCSALRRVGNFQQERFFEHAYARRWTEAGYTSAFLGQKYCFHQAPGKGESVYEREGTLR